MNYAIIKREKFNRRNSCLCCFTTFALSYSTCYIRRLEENVKVNRINQYPRLLFTYEYFNSIHYDLPTIFSPSFFFFSLSSNTAKKRFLNLKKKGEEEKRRLNYSSKFFAFQHLSRFTKEGRLAFQREKPRGSRVIFTERKQISRKRQRNYSQFLSFLANWTLQFEENFRKDIRLNYF